MSNVSSLCSFICSLSVSLSSLGCWFVPSLARQHSKLFLNPCCFPFSSVFSASCCFLILYNPGWDLRLQDQPLPWFIQLVVLLAGLVGCALVFCWLICFFLHSFSPSAVVCYNSISVELFRKLFFGCLQLSAWGLFTDRWDSQSLQHFLKQNLIISSSNGWFQFFLYFNACSDIRQQLNYLKN